MYLAKKLIGALAMPLAVSTILAAAAVVLWARRRREGATWLLVSAMILVYVSSLVPVGDALLHPLERQYPSLGATGRLPTVGYIVVLGSSYSPRAGISVTGALDEDGLARIVEGVRLARRLGAVRLVVSGGAPAGRVPVARGYAALARELGIDDASMIVLDRPLDTAAEAQAVAALLGDAPFILVTSAYHMPRAVRLMRRAGARPIPAPTGQRAGGPIAHYWSYFLPSSAGLRRTEYALHEYLGLAALAAGVDRAQGMCRANPECPRRPCTPEPPALRAARGRSTRLRWVGHEPEVRQARPPIH